MKKVDLGQMISILANVGVIAGIVFLGVELRQNTRSAQVSAYQDLTGRIIEFVGEGVDRSPIDYDGSSEAFQRLSQDEQRRLRSIAVTRLRFGDLAFYQHEMGMLSSERFESLIRPVTNELCNWPRPEVWSGLRQNFVSGYRDYIDSRVAEC